MNNDVYQQIVEEYQKNRKKQEDYNQLVAMKEALEKEEIVQKYVELTELIKKSDKRIVAKSDDELIDDAYNKNSYLIKKTNKIFVYVGSYSYAVAINIRGTIDKSVDRDDPNADYRLYIDLEKKLETKRIPIAEADEFERTNKIIFANNRQEYCEIHDQFVRESVRYGQEEAIQKILKK